MITKRHARAVLVTSFLWGALHSLLGAVLGAWTIRHAAGPWRQVPEWMLGYGAASFRQGLVAGVAFCILLHVFERSLTVETLSRTRVVGWGILASLLTFGLTLGTLPALLAGNYVGPDQLITLTVGGVVSGAVVSLATLGLARGRADRDRPEAPTGSRRSRLLGPGLLLNRFWKRSTKATPVEFAAITRH